METFIKPSIENCSDIALATTGACAHSVEFLDTLAEVLLLGALL